MARRTKPAAEGYIGQEPLTLVRLTSGTFAYVYKGEKVPADVHADELIRLADEGFIVEAPAAAKAPAKAAAAKSTPAGKEPAKPATSEPASTPASDSTPADDAAAEGASADAGADQ